MTLKSRVARFIANEYGPREQQGSTVYTDGSGTIISEAELKAMAEAGDRKAQTILEAAKRGLFG